MNNREARRFAMYLIGQETRMATVVSEVVSSRLGEPDAERVRLAMCEIADQMIYRSGFPDGVDLLADPMPDDIGITQYVPAAERLEQEDT